ncbi:glycerate kinase [Cellulomonas hominis]
MHVLLAPDRFDPSLPASEAARALALGWADARPADTVAAVPLGDGGPGFGDSVRAALGGELLAVDVRGPLGGLVPGAVLVVRGPAGRVTAYVDSGHATAPGLLPGGVADVGRTSSAGVGRLLRAALDTGATRVVVGVGQGVTHDAGAGLLAELAGAEPGSALDRGGLALAEVGSEDLGLLGPVVRELRRIDLVAAVDVDLPLLGLHGASSDLAEHRGGDPGAAQELERALGHFAHVVGRVLDGAGVPGGTGAPGGAGRVDLLAGARGSGPRQAALPGAGAGGGIGYALALLGARLLPGAAVLADATGLAAQVEQADVVVTGTTTLDWRTLHGGVVGTVAGLALPLSVPTVALGVDVRVGRREWGAEGVAAVYVLTDDAAAAQRWPADPAGVLRARAARVASTWSR